MDQNGLDSLRSDQHDWEGMLITFWHSYRLHALVALGVVMLFYSYSYKPKSEVIIADSPLEKPERNPNEAHQQDIIRDQKLKQDTNQLGPTKTIPAQQEVNHKNDSLRRRSPKRLTGTKSKHAALPREMASKAVFKVQPLVFFSSLTGSTESYAKSLVKKLSASEFLKSSSLVVEPQIHDLSYIDFDDYFVAAPQSPAGSDLRYFYLILVPSYNIDTVLNTFLTHLQETHHDFRIGTTPLAGLLGYSVFGFGDREGWPTEGEGFCSQAREVDRWMAKLTDRRRAFPLGMGDVKSDAEQRLGEWREGVEEIMRAVAENGGLGEGVSGSGDPNESDEEEVDGQDDVQETTEQVGSLAQRKQKKRKERAKDVGMDDLEDLGRAVSAQQSSATQSQSAALPLAIDFTTHKSPIGPSSLTTQEPKPMVPKSSPTYASLTKQGYTIIGSHSGVKICRWTKSALRGRGSCYKRTFYGIASHLCMETTPSLSCSNKCVFCWRHGTNPVGTTWRWQVDPPEMIFQEAKKAHLAKIKMMRGVPGVRAERFQEAMRIRHCALSLVGEPIFYPHINDFVSLLHGERISSFLVCNAQHPDHLAALKMVTQLYVSIDASNRESLRKIDRPLHRDYWERFMRCLDIMRERRFRMRTVFRLTLVKGFNVEGEVEGYADLVARGLPCFVEVKGVTYCGTSTTASVGLSMQNVPFYAEVAAFVTALDGALARRGLAYGIAAEHAHSCCVLLASERFRIDGAWHTTIDYGRFFELLEERGEDFSPEDYVGPPTPEWALWGRGGFDPLDERVDRKGRKIEV